MWLASSAILTSLFINSSCPRRQLNFSEILANVCIRVLLQNKDSALCQKDESEVVKSGPHIIMARRENKGKDFGKRQQDREGSKEAP
jgi:hypothetical protein